MKQTHSFCQGSPEWEEHRRKHMNASDASAAMGLSQFKTRGELMRDMATGITPEHDSATLARFAKGHEFEEIARPWAEEIIGGDLFPVVMSNEIHGLPLSASFDGIDMAEEFTFEHKTANAKLLAALEAGDIPAEYKPQMEQGLLISGATRCLFMASAGDKDAMRYAWYESDSAVRSSLLAAWEQFSIDLANFQYVESAPVATAAPINELPALMVEITGSVTASNLSQWREIVVARIAGINTDLQTDQDFADADQMVKLLDDGEKRIDLVKSQAQANAADIDRVFRALDEIKASMRAKRLELDKLVKARKENIRGEIASEGLAKLNDHVDALNKRLGRKLIQPAGDFHAAIKGKRMVKSLRDACDSELARAKIAASEQADRIQINLNAYADLAPGHEFLFRDLDALVLKDADGFSAIIQQRIDAHKKYQEANRLAANPATEPEPHEQNQEQSCAGMASQTSQCEVKSASKPHVGAAPTGGAMLRASVAAHEEFVRSGPSVTTGVARLLGRLDDLALQMTERELSDLCIHAAHILSSRPEAA